MRWNLKEAVSKLLVRRTEITYEARIPLGKSAKKDKAVKLPFVESSKCGGYMRGKSVHLKRGGLTEVSLA